MQFEIGGITCCSTCIAILVATIHYVCMYIYNEESYVRIEGKVLRLKMSSQEKNDIFSFEAVFSRKSGLQTCC